MNNNCCHCCHHFCGSCHQQNQCNQCNQQCNHNCGQWPNQNNGPIVAVKNCGSFRAEFQISYCLNGQAYNRDSGIFCHGGCRAIRIPSNAYNICLTIKVFHCGMGQVVCNRPISNSRNLCFMLSGTICRPCCRRIPCRCLI